VAIQAWDSKAPRCWGAYGFIGQGSLPNISIPRIPSGTHRPQVASYPGASIDFYANYYDAGGDPKHIDVVIDGKCRPMTVELGQPGNRTYTFRSNFAAGCHQYYFAAVDASGASATFPARGAYRLAGMGCAAEPDFQDERLGGEGCAPPAPAPDPGTPSDA